MLRGKTEERSKDVKDPLEDPQKAGLQNHGEKAELEGDNFWCSYLSVEDKQNDHQLPSFWRSM